MKRVICSLLLLAMVLTLIPANVFANPAGELAVEPVELEDCLILESLREEGSALLEDTAELCAEDEMAVLDAANYTTMSCSQKMLDVIKDFEGFNAYKYWDNTQYTIGYGTACGKWDYPNGISRSEAEALLRKQLGSFENEVNAYFRKIGRQPTQQQFDALLDFTYNIGGSWTYSSSYLINKYLMNPTNELDLLRALGSWCRVGSSVNTTLCGRRVMEAIIYTKGEYYVPYGNISTSLKAVALDKLPYYTYLVFDANGGMMTAKYSVDVNYYVKGYSYGSLPTPTRSGRIFGWWYRPDGTWLSKASTVKVSNKVYAKWFYESLDPYPKDPDNEGKPAYGGGSNSNTTPVTPPASVTPPAPVTPPEPVGNGTFKDVSPKSWYNDAVMFVYNKGYMKGTSPDLFTPDGTMTRGMLVTILHRLAGKPSTAGLENPFTDVKSGKYYSSAVRWAKANGIINGVTPTEFRPDELITREQIATIMYRYYTRYLGRSANSISDLSDFTDCSQVSTFAKKGLGWAVSNGLVNGVTKTTLEPGGYATRAQAAAIMQRFAEKVL